MKMPKLPTLSLNVKAALFTALAVIVLVGVLILFINYPVDCVVLAMLLAILYVIGYGVHKLYIMIRDDMIENEFKKWKK